MESINRMAVELVDEALDFAGELNVGAHEAGEATVLDFGVEFDGGIEAGLLLAEIATGGLATVGTTMGSVAGASLPYVEMTTDHPAVALLGSQRAGMEISVGDFEALGSGPARAMVAGEEIYGRLGFRDEFDLTVLCLETDDLPDAAVAERIAELTGVEESGVFLATYPTASIAGSVATAARAAEMAVGRLADLGYDPLDVRTAAASAPVAPVAGDERAAIAATNDAVAHGGRVHLVVDEPFDRFDEVPATASEAWGTPFADLFEEHGLEGVPAEAFAPATVTVDVVGGPTEVHGRHDEDVLVSAFGL